MQTIHSPTRTRQHGVAMLSTTLVVLVAMSIMTAIGARVAINNQRIAANSAHTDSAFQAADAGVDNALAYLNHNSAYVASSDTNGWFNAGSSQSWFACAPQTPTDLTDPADGAPPCGNGAENLYGSDWVAYGPVPNLQAVSADYATDVFLLSDNINDALINDVDLGCLNLSLAALLPVPFINDLNSLLNSVLGLLTLLNPLAMSHLNDVGLPTDLCLPLNFSGADRPPAPSNANPTVRVVSVSDNLQDPRGGHAQLQQDLQTASRFAWDPMAAIMVDGTANLDGEIHVWGNPRPPTRPPFDWSILDLNDVGPIGLDVTGLLGTHLGTIGAPLHALTLAPLLNLTVAEVLALDINVTFPLAIWSHQNTTLEPGPLLSANVPLLGSPSLNGVLSGARTCLPPYAGNFNCTVFLSTSVGIKQLLGLLSVTVPIELPDIQDEHNLVNSITDGLLDSSAPVDFPEDLFDHIFGVPLANASLIEEDAVALSDCSDLHNKPAGLYWVSGDCDINGTVGSVTDPLIVIAEGNLTMTAGSEFWGVMYLMGPSSRSVSGSTTAPTPIIHGSLLVGAHLNATNDFNVVYDRDAIRRAGYRAGSFTRLPGGWTDELTGP